MSSDDASSSFRAPGPYGPAGEIVPKHQVLLQLEADSSLQDGLQRMLDEGFSLAPVSHRGRVVGALSLQSVVRQLLAFPEVQAALANHTAGEHIEAAVFVPPERWVDTDFDWQGDTAALVGRPEHVHGIITHAHPQRRVDDFTRAFRIIAETELAIRKVLEELFPMTTWGPAFQRVFDAATSKLGDPYKPRSVEDFSYWHYEMVFRDAEFQEVLAPHVIVPCGRLADMTKKARLIRNDVVHFRRPADGNMVENLEVLRIQVLAIVGSMERTRSVSTTE